MAKRVDTEQGKGADARVGEAEARAAVSSHNVVADDRLRKVRIGRLWYHDGHVAEHEHQEGRCVLVGIVQHKAAACRGRVEDGPKLRWVFGERGAGVHAENLEARGGDFCGDSRGR